MGRDAAQSTTKRKGKTVRGTKRQDDVKTTRRRQDDVKTEDAGEGQGHKTLTLKQKYRMQVKNNKKTN